MSGSATEPGLDALSASRLVDGFHRARELGRIESRIERVDRVRRGLELALFVTISGGVGALMVGMWKLAACWFGPLAVYGLLWWWQRRLEAYRDLLAG